MQRWYPTIVKSLMTRWKQRSLNIRSWKSFPDLQIKSVAIVGNAGYLSQIDQGPLIDAHDLVIRMNNFQICGFERQVGSRIDLFMTNFFKDIDYERPELRSVKHLVASVPNNFRKLRRSYVPHRHAENIVAGMRALQRSEVYVPEWPLVDRWIRASRCFPSTGMMAALFALEFLTCTQIYFTGFSFFQGTAHYFPGQPAKAPNHNFKFERKYIQTRLRPHVQSGRVTIDPIMQATLKFPRSSVKNQIA